MSDGGPSTSSREGCEHEWRQDYEFPVIDTYPETVTYRCVKCRAIGTGDYSGQASVTYLREDGQVLSAAEYDARRAPP